MCRTGFTSAPHHSVLSLAWAAFFSLWIQIRCSGQQCGAGGPTVCSSNHNLSSNLSCPHKLSCPHNLSSQLVLSSNSGPRLCFLKTSSSPQIGRVTCVSAGPACSSGCSQGISWFSGCSLVLDHSSLYIHGIEIYHVYTMRYTMYIYIPCI